MRQLLVLAILVTLALTMFAFGQAGQAVQAGQQGAAAGQRGQRGPALPPGAARAGTAARPTPRLSNGRVNLSSVAGAEAGIWRSLGGSESFIENDNAQPRVASQAPKKPKFSEVPFQPWAKALLDHRRENPLEPHTRCKPSGGPRQFLTPYGTEFVDDPELQRILIMDEGGPHTYRIIYMDGRPHPKNPEPSYYGHNVGHWEGDTLVVDSVGYNEAFWFTRQGINTEKLHLIERFTRLDYDTMKYEATIDDPGAYTAPWSSGFLMKWIPGQELWEYICQDNNYAPDLMVGSQKSIDRSSQIVP